jgi:hypothetical protein
VLKSNDGDDDRKALRTTILNQIINGSANSLLNPGNGRKPLFVNGSDIYFLVNEAMSACLEKCKNASEKDRKPLENELPVSESEFILALQEIIGGKSPADSEDGAAAKRSSGFTSQGYGDTNLMQLAETELRTIRGSFTPCSAQPLFTSADYSEVEENPEGHSRIPGLRKVKIADKSDRLPKNSYDRALYTALRERMEKFTLQPVSLDAQ